jgi:hypothetical protein
MATLPFSMPPNCWRTPLSGLTHTDIDVIHPDFRIDFDYGPNGQIDCFDVWRLAVHRHHLTDAKPPVGPYDDIREWVGDATEQGELLTVPGSYNAFFQDATLLRSPESICAIG